MPLPREIVHNCTIQQPSKPSMPVDMEMVWGLPDCQEVNSKERFWQVSWCKTPVDPRPWVRSIIPLPSWPEIIHPWHHCRQSIHSPKLPDWHPGQAVPQIQGAHINPLQQDIFKSLLLSHRETQNLPTPQSITKSVSTEHFPSLQNTAPHTL